MNEHHRPSVVFVIGSGRSGTTVVLDSVSRLEDITAVPRLAGRAPALTVPAVWLRRLKVAPRAWVRPSAESSALFSEAGLTQQFQTRVGGSIDASHAQYLQMSRLRHRLDSVRRHSSANTVVVKNTASCARIPILAETFSDAVFVHVLRRPASVVRSLLRAKFWPEMTLWWDGRTTRQYARDEGYSQEEVAARHWTRQVATAACDLLRLDPLRSKILRYEEFVVDPVGSIGGLGELGLNVSPADLERRLTPVEIRVSDATQQVSRAISRAIASHCSETAERFGLPL